MNGNVWAQFFELSTPQKMTKLFSFNLTFDQ